MYLRTPGLCSLALAVLTSACGSNEIDPSATTTESLDPTTSAPPPPTTSGATDPSIGPSTGATTTSDGSAAESSGGSTSDPAQEVDPWEVVPPTIFKLGPPCIGPDGQVYPSGQRFLVGDCSECQCTTYGLTCRRSPGCARDVCVFVDGQEVARGDAAVVADCFDCTCDGEAATPIGACSRRTQAPCPADGCIDVLGMFVPVGGESLISECHGCVCDAALGLLCSNVCHPECVCVEGGVNAGCEEVCGGDCAPLWADLPTPLLSFPDQAQVTTGENRCICDYSSFTCSQAE